MRTTVVTSTKRYLVVRTSGGQLASDYRSLKDLLSLRLGKEQRERIRWFDEVAKPGNHLIVDGRYFILCVDPDEG